MTTKNAIHNNSNTLERPLGTVESFHYILNDCLAILRNVVVAVQLKKSVNISYLVFFLESAHNHFSALRLRIQEQNNVPFFISDVPFERIPIILQTYTAYDHQNLIEDIETQMNTPMDAHIVMWRAQIIDAPLQKLLILTFHHTIFDGRSIIKLLKYLESNSHQSIQKKKYPTLYPAIEESMHYNPQNSKKIEAHSVKTNGTDWPVHQTCEIKNQTSKCQIIHIDAISVPSLKIECRQNAISVNQLLNAVTVKTMAALCPEKENLLLHTPIDLTPYSTTDRYQNEIGCFISVVQSKITDFKKKGVIEIANLYSKAFHNNFCHSSVNNNFNFHAFKNTLTEKFKNKTRYFSGGIAVSNIGEIKLNGSSIINDVVFSTTLLGGLGLFVLSALSIHDRLKLTFSYTDPLLNHDFVTAFIHTFKNTIGRLM